MKALLTADGVNSPVLQLELRQLVDRDTRELSAVFVTTAANAAPPGKLWLVSQLTQARSFGWKQFDIVDVALHDRLPSALVSGVIERADVVFVGGGNVSYLSHHLKGSGMFDTLRKTESVYVGCCAGSMLAGSSLGDRQGILAEYWLDAIGDQRSSDTFGWLDLILRPHYGDEYFSCLDDDYLQNLAIDEGRDVLALTNDAAAVINDDDVRIVGGQWRRFEPVRLH